MTLQQVQQRAYRHLSFNKEIGRFLSTVKATRRWKYWMNQSFRRKYTSCRRSQYRNTKFRVTEI